MREALRNLRIKRGLTHQDVASRAGIARVTYTNIEIGNKNPSLAVAVRIKQALNHTGDEIFLDDGAPKRNNLR